MFFRPGLLDKVGGLVKVAHARHGLGGLLGLPHGLTL